MTSPDDFRKNANIAAEAQRGKSARQSSGGVWLKNFLLGSCSVSLLLFTSLAAIAVTYKSCTDIRQEYLDETARLERGKEGEERGKRFFYFSDIAYKVNENSKKSLESALDRNTSWDNQSTSTYITFDIQKIISTINMDMNLALSNLDHGIEIFENKFGKNTEGLNQYIKWIERHAKNQDDPNPSLTALKEIASWQELSPDEKSMLQIIINSPRIKDQKPHIMVNGVDTGEKSIAPEKQQPTQKTPSGQ